VISGIRYKVDSGVSASNLIRPIIGQITKSTDVEVFQDVTFTKDQNYKFNLRFEHAIPRGGYFIITLPAGGDVVISNAVILRTTCLSVTLNTLITCTNI
jgi:hypothetical protein